MSSATLLVAAYAAHASTSINPLLPLVLTSAFYAANANTANTTIAWSAVRTASGAGHKHGTSRGAGPLQRASRSTQASHTTALLRNRFSSAAIPKALLFVGDVRSSPGNIFFHTDGRVLYAEPSDELVQFFFETGCGGAWRRHLHQETTFDRTCDEIISPFLRSAPGGALGLIETIFIATRPNDSPRELGQYDLLDDGTPATYPLYVSESLVKDDVNGQAVVDLSPLDWWSDSSAVPPMLFAQSIPSSSKRELRQALGYQAPNPGAYFVHHVGERSFELALEQLGGAEADEDAAFTAALHAVELWTFMANHVNQRDAMHPAYEAWGAQDTNELLVHGAHGAMWKYAQWVMTHDIEYAASANMWTILEKLCVQARQVDEAIYGSCAHGLGHILTYYVSAGRNTVAEASAVCASEPHENAHLIRMCFAGFAHEFARGNIWQIDMLGHNFLPYGEQAPCDTAVSRVAAKECFHRLTGVYDHEDALSQDEHMNIGGTGEARLDVLSAAWIDVANATVGGKQTQVISLTDTGRTAMWNATISFCALANYSMGQRQACVNSFVKWTRDAMQVIARGDPRLTETLACLSVCFYWNVDSFDIGNNPTESFEDGGWVPWFQVQEIAEVNGMQPRVLAGSTDVWSLTLVLCQIATGPAAVSVWRACASMIFPATNPDRHFVDSKPYDKVPFAFANVSTHHEARVGNLTSLDTDSLETQYETCNRYFSLQNFDHGSELELQFMLSLCKKTAQDRRFHDSFEWATEPELWSTAPKLWVATEHTNVTASKSMRHLHARPRHSEHATTSTTTSALLPADDVMG